MFDSSNQNLEWQSPPKNVLIIKKPSDSQVTEKFKAVAKWLIEVTLDTNKAKAYSKFTNKALEKRVQSFGS